MVYLAPFLEVIRSENTTGPITGVALSSINKFLSYNLLSKCDLINAQFTNRLSSWVKRYYTDEFQKIVFLIIFE